MRASQRPGVLLVLAIVVALLVPGLVAGPAEAATGRVRGTIMGAKGDPSPQVKVTWFTQDWTFVGSRKAHGGGYSLALEPGTYHLQFTDQRPGVRRGEVLPGRRDGDRRQRRHDGART